ncbi:MAG TPA: TetR/AcrR family transcriptional regulator [Gemmatimonadaceae bacterium]
MTQPAAPGPHRARQERGQRRVDAILDAAAACIAEAGIAAVTMHGVARRSGTTTGSMYHFFPDRDALLRELAARHAQRLRELAARVERESAAEWSGLSTPAAVDRFLDPFLTYIDRHPDFPPVARHARGAGWAAERDSELDRQAVRLAEAVVASRCPDATTAERAARARAMTAMAEGVVRATAPVAGPADDEASPTVLRRELRRALVAYLESYAAPGPPPVGAPHGGAGA